MAQYCGKQATNQKFKAGIKMTNKNAVWIRVLNGCVSDTGIKRKCPFGGKLPL